MNDSRSREVRFSQKNLKEVRILPDINQFYEGQDERKAEWEHYRAVKQELENKYWQEKVVAHDLMADMINDLMQLVIKFIGDSPQDFIFVVDFNSENAKTGWILYDNQIWNMDKPRFWSIFTAEGKIITSRSSSSEGVYMLEETVSPLRHYANSGILDCFHLVKMFDGLLAIGKKHGMVDMISSQLQAGCDACYARYCRAEAMLVEKTWTPR